MMWVSTALRNIAKPRVRSACQNGFPNSCSALSDISLTSTCNSPCSRRILEISFSTFSGSRWSRNRSEEHTSELQSLTNLVCRLLLEKKKKQKKISGQISIHTTPERLV